MGRGEGGVLCVCVSVSVSVSVYVEGGGSVYKQYNKICRVQVSLHFILVFITFFSPLFVFSGRSATLWSGAPLAVSEQPAARSI